MVPAVEVAQQLVRVESVGAVIDRPTAAEVGVTAVRRDAVPAVLGARSGRALGLSRVPAAEERRRRAERGHRSGEQAAAGEACHAAELWHIKTWIVVVALSAAGQSTRSPPRHVACAPMRLIVARCEVTYTGRLNAVLPEALRLLMIKSDGSVMVHADTGGFKPQNWMTPPTVIEEEAGLIVVRKRAGATEDRLDIRIAEVF